MVVGRRWGTRQTLWESGGGISRSVHWVQLQAARHYRSGLEKHAVRLTKPIGKRICAFGLSQIHIHLTLILIRKLIYRIYTISLGGYNFLENNTLRWRDIMLFCIAFWNYIKIFWIKIVKEDKEFIHKNVIEEINEKNYLSWFVLGCILSPCQVS